MVPTHFTFGSHVLSLGPDGAFPLQIVMQNMQRFTVLTVCVAIGKKAVPEGSILKAEYEEC